MRDERRISTHLFPTLIYVAAYCAFMAPSFARFDTHILSSGIDGSQGLWSYWWVRHAVANLGFPWHTDYLFHPHGVTLFGAVLIPFNGFASVPLCWFFDQVTAYNVLIVFSFVATGYTTFLFAREATGTFWPSVFAGAVLTFSPFHFGHAGGHMHLTAIEWLPFFLFAWLRFLRLPGHGRGLLAAFALLLVLLCDYYSTLFAVMTGGLMLVWHAVSQRDSALFPVRRSFAPLATFAGTSLLLCGPILGGLIRPMIDDPFVAAHQAAEWKNDLFAFLVPGPGWVFHEWTEPYWGLHPLGENASELGSFLGVSVLLACGCAIAGCRQTRTVRPVAFWTVVGVVFYLLSLGPELLVLGEIHPGVPMPYRAFEAIPGMKLAGVPVRLELVTYIAVAVLSAFGISHAWSRVGARKLLVPFLALFAFEFWPRPPHMYRPLIPPVIEQLADLPPGAVAGFDSNDPKALYFQTLFEKPIVGGYIARVPESRHAIAVELDALRTEGRYDEIMRRTGATYLLRDRASMRPVRDTGLKLVIADDYYELFAVASSPLPAIARPDDEPFVRVLPDRADARVVTLEVRSPGDQGCPFHCVFSLSMAEPRAMIFHHQLDVTADALLRTSLDPQNPLFVGNQGTLDGIGRARIMIRREYLPGPQAVWCSLIVIEGTLPDVRRIYRPVRLELR